MKKQVNWFSFLLCCSVCFSSSAAGSDYDYLVTGSTADVRPENTQGALMLAGGGGMVDDASVVASREPSLVKDDPKKLSIPSRYSDVTSVYLLPRYSFQELPDHVTMHVGKATFDSVVIKGQTRVIDA